MLNPEVEEQFFLKQRQIPFTLPQEVLHTLLATASEMIERQLLGIKSRDDKVIDKSEDGEELTLHNYLKYKIYKNLFVFDRILQSEHFQELYHHTWAFDKDIDEDYVPYPSDGSEKDFYQRYQSIKASLHLLTSVEGIVPYPSEVKRFCDKFRSQYDEEHWKKFPKFWEDAGKYFRKQENEKK